MAPDARDVLPEECQLCRLMDYRDDEINPPGGIVTMSNADDDLKLVHCCERCADELFDDHDFAPYTKA